MAEENSETTTAADVALSIVLNMDRGIKESLVCAATEYLIKYLDAAEVKS